MKRVLVLSGGGVRGIMQAVVLAKMEETIGRPLHQVFDLIVGTSVGSISGSLLSSGMMSASKILEMMYRTIPRMFSLRVFPLFPKYSRKEFDRVWFDNIGLCFPMKRCATKFMCTSVNLCDDMTHYFKSWEKKDGELYLHDAVTRSYAAPVYFGTDIDEASKSVWMDGGVGVANCPLMEAVIECVRQKWMGEPLHILNIGTGFVDNSIPFDQARRYRTLRQVFSFVDPDDGGLARRQSVQTFVEATKSIAESVPGCTFDNLDCQIRKETALLDGVKYIPYYIDRGIEMAGKVNYDHLK